MKSRLNPWVSAITGMTILGLTILLAALAVSSPAAAHLSSVYAPDAEMPIQSPGGRYDQECGPGYREHDGDCVPLKMPCYHIQIAPDTESLAITPTFAGGMGTACPDGVDPTVAIQDR